MPDMHTRLPQLSARLAMTAQLVPPGVAVADIGSDHAYLPVELVRQGICPRAIASDIGAGPLENARQTVRRAGLSDKIELRLSDGFTAFSPGDATCWVMAGMGGTLMARLLDAAPWLCAKSTVIVAQPMRHAQDLRFWLITHGFYIDCEAACRDAGKAYSALRAVYDGAKRKCTPGYAYYGELPACGDPCAREILLRELQLLRVRMDALQLSGQNPYELEHLTEVYDDLGTRCI